MRPLYDKALSRIHRRDATARVRPAVRGEGARLLGSIAIEIACCRVWQSREGDF